VLDPQQEMIVAENYNEKGEGSMGTLQMKKSVFLAVAVCSLVLSVSVSQAAYVDITCVTGNIAPTGTMSDFGGAVPHPALPGASVANMNRPGTTGNGEISVPVYPQAGADDNEALIWNDVTPDEQQVMRLTFSSPVHLKEVGIFGIFAGVGNGDDRCGNNPSFRINGGEWMLFDWTTKQEDAQNWWDYIGVTGNFTNVVTVDYSLGDWTAGVSPRIGAVTAIEVPEPMIMTLLGLGSVLCVVRRQK